MGRSTGRRQELTGGSPVPGYQHRAVCRNRPPSGAGTRRLYRCTLLTALLLVAGMLAGFAFQQRRSATPSGTWRSPRQVAIEADRLRGNDPSLAAQLALAAYRIAPPSRPLQPPRLLRRPDPDAGARFAEASCSRSRSHGRRTMATTGPDRAVRLWNLAGPSRAQPVGRPLIGHTDTVYSSPSALTATCCHRQRRPDRDGCGQSATRSAGCCPANPQHRLFGRLQSRRQDAAAGSADNTVHLWDLTDPVRPRALPPLTGPTNYVQAVAFSPDGDVLARGEPMHRAAVALAGTRRPVPLGRPWRAREHGVLGRVQPGRADPRGGQAGTKPCGSGTSPPAVPPSPRTADRSAELGELRGVQPRRRDIAVGGSDNTVRIYDLDSRRWRPDLPHHRPGHHGRLLDGHRSSPARRTVRPGSGEYPARHSTRPAPTS